MFNFIKPLFCHQPKHVPVLRYNGMSVLGYKCECCGYEWYEDRVYEAPKLKVVKE